MMRIIETLLLGRNLSLVKVLSRLRFFARLHHSRGVLQLRQISGSLIPFPCRLIHKNLRASIDSSHTAAYDST